MAEKLGLAESVAIDEGWSIPPRKSFGKRNISKSKEFPCV
jgi:hypothetical protein